MEKFISLVVLLTSLLVPIVTRPQETPSIDGPQKIFHDDLLDHMVGDWHLSGSVKGEAADHHVQVEWVLNHQFLRIHEKATAPSKSGFVYEVMGMVGYDNASERYVVHWIDVFGGRFSETLGYDPYHLSQMRQKDNAGAWEDFSNFILTAERK